MKLTKEKLILVRELAIQELKELPRGARLKGSNRDLNEPERLAVAWILAVHRVDFTQVEFESQEHESVWEP